MRSHIRGIGMTSQRTRDRLVERLREKGIRSEAVLEVMRRTPRHLFVDEALSSRAYEDTALPIGFNQTISQPYIVARMTEALLAGGVPEKVLEVGTGSGYQAAVLAQLVPRLYTVERIDALVRSARQRFRTLELRNVQLKQSDGSWGWPQQAPFDAILVTAAPAEIPRPLLEQLADGGRLVIPVGGASGQTLAVVTRRGNVYEREDLEPVSFVPLVGGAG
ncbi:MAG: protein-L-isoaspartate(D-aspartate) O-methyltransferase [Gammaproteobacteria bacterium]|jgi:protein-L-isoaspartate(D-aspartate) O-methyltransferase|nr:protein-L-isoaspartate(D-aspartate) O-methyltransferase [Gammaproteobacteria bacterium]